MAIAALIRLMPENPKDIDIHALAREMGAEPRVKGKSAGSSDSDGLQVKLEKLTEKYDRLYTLSRATWELVRESTELEEEDLIQRVITLEAQKNIATKPKASPCPDCDRPLQRIEGKHNKCIYCGYIQEFTSPFDKLL